MNNALMRNIGPGATRYAYIEKLLAAAISRGDLPANIVLTEGQLAGLFDTSRTPVRSALASLQEQGLLKRFDGRGYLVAGGEDDQPNRQKITRAMLGVSEDAQRICPRPHPAALKAMWKKCWSMPCPLAGFRSMNR